MSKIINKDKAGKEGYVSYTFTKQDTVVYAKTIKEAHELMEGKEKKTKADKPQKSSKETKE